MPDRLVRVGLVQTASHPALVLDDIDLLQEPFLPDALRFSVSLLLRHGFELRAALAAVRGRYIDWQRERIKGFLNMLATQPSRPDVLCFPECSVPFEVLSDIRDYAKQTASVVFAGTHTPRLDADAGDSYRSLGVGKRTRTTLFEDGHGPLAVLPIVSAKDTLLHEKLVPSIFEVSDFTPATTDTNPVRIATVGTPKLRYACFVCAEALRLPAYGSERPEVAVIVARERNPQRFRSHIDLLVQNKTPVVLINDASVGGSAVYAPLDDRAAHWWFDSPFNGTLPVGEYYLELELNLDASTIQVGTAAPAPPLRVTRLLPIFAETDVLIPYEEKAHGAAAARDRGGLLAVIRDLEQIGSATMPLVVERWRLAERMINAGSLSGDKLAVFGDHFVTQRLGDITALEAEASGVLADALEQDLHSKRSGAVTNEAFGLAHRILSTLKARARPSPPPSIAPASLPFDRTEPLSETHRFISGTTARVLLVSGLEGIGKSAILLAALAQTAARVLRVPCNMGTSADFVFEYIVRSSGRVPPGRAPRATFDLADLTDALRGKDVLYIDNAHHLVESGAWKTIALDLLVRRVLEAAEAAKVRVVIESRRQPPISLEQPQSVVRRRVEGLPAADASAFFESQLRRAGVSLDTTSEQQRAEIVRLVDGHPGILALCADACKHTSVDGVIADLRGRTGFIRSVVQRLFDSLGLDDDQRKCLQALAECRGPVGAEVLESITSVGDHGKQAQNLVDLCVIGQTTRGELSVTPLLTETARGLGALSKEESARLHAGASRYFARKAATALGLIAYGASFEANYHAALAGIAAPCDMAGVLDGVLGAAKERYDRQQYSDVIALVEPIWAGDETRGGSSLPEDLLAMLADSFAWSGQFDKALDLGRSIVTRNRNYVWVFTRCCEAALHSHRKSDAKRALEMAETFAPSDYRVLTLRGRLAEQDHDVAGAIDYFREAARNAPPWDSWPKFRLARVLVRNDEIEEALEIIGAAREALWKQSGPGAKNVENALMSQEMLALLLLGKHDAAQHILHVLDQAPDPKPEKIIAGAYVRAYYEDMLDEAGVISAFDKALERLGAQDIAKAHTRAQIEMFRGQLRERKGDLIRAVEDYRKASVSDPQNMYMKVRLLRGLRDLRLRAQKKGDTVAVEHRSKELAEVVTAILAIDPRQKEAGRVKTELASPTQ